ncbi:TolB-like translocation protein [Pseudothermotoga sp.]|nr:hypothetical protein [Pseudothermotoga sp.]MDW8139882.1 hypothetical protein [Pseudothermotoga sp.]
MRSLHSFFLIIVASTLWAAGTFNMLSTKYLDILYDDGLARSAYRLSQKADEVYENFTAEFKSSLRKRPKVYLLKSDLSNGYANPLNNVIVIYVSDMDPYQFTPNYEDWVVFCFRHELAHLFLANKFAPYAEKLSIFGHSVAAAVQSILTPMYLHEGVAIVYESKEQGEGRANDVIFDLYKQNALSTDIGLRYASSINTTRFTPGGASYTFGYALLETIEKKKRGATVHLVEDFSKDPLATFYRHLRKIASPKELEEAWSNVERSFDGEKLTELSLLASKLNLELWRVYYIFKGYDETSAIYFYDIFEGKHHKLLETPSIVSFSVNSRRELAIVKMVVEEGRYVSKLLLWNGSVNDLNVKHVIDVSWVDDERLALIVQENDIRKIKVLDVKRSITQDVVIPHNLTPLQISASKNRIVFTAKDARNVDLYMLESERLIKLTSDGKAKLSPVVLGDVIYFVSDRKGELRTFRLDLRTNQIHELGVSNSISAVQYEGYIFSIKPLPGGYALFKEDAKIVEQRIEEPKVILGNDWLKLEDVEISSIQYHDALKMRFLLPFPWIDLIQKDFGAGVMVGFWDDLMDNVLAGAFVKTVNMHYGQVFFNSSRGLTVSLSTLNQRLTIDLSISSKTSKSLKNDVFSVAMGLDISSDGTIPKLAFGYALGSVGGLIHLKRFADFSFTVGILPSMYFGLSKAFLFKGLLLEVSGRLGLEGPVYEMEVVLPTIRTNFGSFDGFFALDGLALSFGMLRGTDEEYWAKLYFNGHISYQIPLIPYVKLGLKDGKFFFQVGLEEVLSSLLQFQKDHAIIPTAR